MKLAAMEVNYYLENPVMDIDSEPANYAYRYWSMTMSRGGDKLKLNDGSVKCHVLKERRGRDVNLKLIEQIWGSASKEETKLCESMLNA